MDYKVIPIVVDYGLIRKQMDKHLCPQVTPSYLDQIHRKWTILGKLTAQGN